MSRPTEVTDIVRDGQKANFRIRRKKLKETALSNDDAWLALLFFAIALLYASVGQAGASGYLAAMGFFGLGLAAMKTTALSLNLLVAAIGTFQFWRSGLLSVRTFYPFAVLGFPFSLFGGAVQLPGRYYYPVVGVILLLSAVQMIRSALRPPTRHQLPSAEPPLIPALLVGAGIGEHAWIEA